MVEVCSKFEGKHSVEVDTCLSLSILITNTLKQDILNIKFKVIIHG